MNKKKRRLNKKHLNELVNMLSSALSFHMTFWMQDDQDLDKGFRRRELQRRARWKKALMYFDKLVAMAEGDKNEISIYSNLPIGRGAVPVRRGPKDRDTVS